MFLPVSYQAWEIRDQVWFEVVEPLVKSREPNISRLCFALASSKKVQLSNVKRTKGMWKLEGV